MHAHTHACAQKHAHALTYVHMHSSCTHADTCACTLRCTPTYTHTCARRYACTHMQTYVLSHIHRCTHTCTHVHTLTRARAFAHMQTHVHAHALCTLTCTRAHACTRACTCTYMQMCVLTHTQVHTCVHMLSHTRAHIPLCLSEEPGSHHSHVAGTWTGLTTEAQPGSAEHALRDGPVTSTTELRAKAATGSRRSPQRPRPQNGQWGSGSTAVGKPHTSRVRAPPPCPSVVPCAPVPPWAEPGEQARGRHKGTLSCRPAHQSPAARLLPADSENRELPQLCEWTAPSLPLLPVPQPPPLHQAERLPPRPPLTGQPHRGRRRLQDEHAAEAHGDQVPAEPGHTAAPRAGGSGVGGLLGAAHRSRGPRGPAQPPRAPLGSTAPPCSPHPL